MPAIFAKAPGKIILFGEHAVVYNQPAIAVPVFQVQAKAHILPLFNSPAGTIKITASNINLDDEISHLDASNPIARAINLTCEQLGLARIPAFHIQITSTIPVASGLGSGAAVSVAIIRAVSAFFGHPLPDEDVNNLAFEVEKIHHGTPSGIDNTVITYAMPVYFIRNHPPQPFAIAKPFHIAIADSGIHAQTGQVVQGVRQRWQAQQDVYESSFQQIGKITEQAKQCLEAGNLSSLGELMSENHRLLQDIGVSSSQLDDLVQAALHSGAHGAKLSGSGVGGNIIAYADEATLPAVQQALLDAGARQVIITRVQMP